MKKMKLWSMMMFMLVTLPLMVACGGDDDEGSGTSGYDGVLTITIDGNEHQYTTSGEFGLEIVKYFNNSHDLTFVLYSMSGSGFLLILHLHFGHSYTMSWKRPLALLKAGSWILPRSRLFQSGVAQPQ